jgi:hypothetical protein
MKARNASNSRGQKFWKEYIQITLARCDAGKAAGGPEFNPEIAARIDALRSLEPSGSLCLELDLLRLETLNAHELGLEVDSLRKAVGAVGEKITPSDTPTPAERAALLSEARYLTAQVFKQHELREVFESVKLRTIFWMFVVFLLFSISSLAFGILEKWNQGILAVEVILGTSGGFISSFLRVYRMDPGLDVMSATDGLTYERASLLVKPLVGGVFALVLHLLFISQLLSGGLFPKITIACPEEPVYFLDFFLGSVTATSADFAKLLVWCFVAGFAERFVPDILGRLSNRAARGE